MADLRNQRGDPVQQFSASDAKNSFGRVLELAARDGMVTITRHDQARAVVLSIEEYAALKQGGDRVLDTLAADFDAMVARMNAPGAADRILDVFAAPPETLGRLAVKAARRKRA